MKKCITSAALAAFIALSAGCQTFSNGMTSPFVHSDETITASVNTAIQNSNQFYGSPITVHAHDGRVQLSGYVKTIRQSDLAADIASKVSGVKAVDNHLIVRK